MMASPTSILRTSAQSLQFWGSGWVPNVPLDAGAIDVQNEINSILPWYAKQSPIVLPSPCSARPAYVTSPRLQAPTFPNQVRPSLEALRKLTWRADESIINPFAHSPRISQTAPRAAGDGKRETPRCYGTMSDNRQLRVSVAGYEKQYANVTSQHGTRGSQKIPPRIMGGQSLRLSTQAVTGSANLPREAQGVLRREREVSASAQADESKPRDRTEETSHGTERQKESTHVEHAQAAYSRGGNDVAASSRGRAPSLMVPMAAGAGGGIENQGGADTHAAFHDGPLTAAQEQLVRGIATQEFQKLDVAGTNALGRVDIALCLRRLNSQFGITTALASTTALGIHEVSQEVFSQFATRTDAGMTSEEFASLYLHFLPKKLTVRPSSALGVVMASQGHTTHSVDSAIESIDDEGMSWKAAQQFRNASYSGSLGREELPVDQGAHQERRGSAEESRGAAEDRRGAAEERRGAAEERRRGPVGDDRVTSDAQAAEIFPKRANVEDEYDILGADVLDGADYAASWAGSSETTCISLCPGFSEECKLRRVSKWQVDPVLWAEHVQCMRAKDMKGVVPVLDVYEDDAYFYAIFAHSAAPLIETLSIILRRQAIPDGVLAVLHEQVEEACEALCNARLTKGEFDVLVREKVGEAGSTYRVEVDPTPAFGLVAVSENGFFEARERIATLLTGPVEDIILAGERQRIARVRTDILVNKGRENHIWQLPGELPSALCNVILREEWLTLLWKVYSQLAETTEPGAQDLLNALLDVPGPWPYAWLKERASTDVPVDFGALRSALHQSNKV
eukprot:GEMP01016157.1.p1 GENE.GEMP01016157.1~~GEMP01016157.1.p1  ORF type:complete len:796 (+),score=223.56 GEMP01016157.1:137-2524(+)